MRWDDIHLERREWLVPETKNGEPLRVHLVDSVIELLKRRLETSGRGEWVFEGTGTHRPPDGTQNGLEAHSGPSWH